MKILPLQGPKGFYYILSTNVVIVKVDHSCMSVPYQFFGLNIFVIALYSLKFNEQKPTM